MIRREDSTPSPELPSAAGRRPGEHDVSIRLPVWFTSDGFSMTLDQLHDPEYVLHAVLPELIAFFHGSPEDLEIKVDGGSWRRIGGPSKDLPDLNGDPRTPWRPDLNEEEVSKLPAEHADVDPASIRYGASLLDVIASQAPWRSWLEAAVRAGHVPHQDGIELAQAAQIVWVRARAQEDVDGGVLGDASGWLTAFAEGYRSFAGGLLAEAEALEAWAADLLEAPARVPRRDPGRSSADSCTDSEGTS